ncbi:hypothetical protein [Rhizobium vallis]|uniref:hypothetical protein n=1 Tax=Rhizobium vallis TaxID=634290 RepID=UPI000F889C0D|nr:hypothetical protein [Rhizobium vallis]
MKKLIGLILLLGLGGSPVSAKDDMKFRTLMESKETDIVTMLIGAAGLTLSFVNSELEGQGKQPLYCPPPKGISNNDYVAIVKKYLEHHPNVGEETFQVYPYVLLVSLKQIYPC